MFDPAQTRSIALGVSEESNRSTVQTTTLTTISTKSLRASRARSNQSRDNKLGQSAARANCEESAEMFGFGTSDVGYNAAKMAEKLDGVVERVTFHNLDNGFAVLRVTPEGRRDPVTVVGT